MGLLRHSLFIDLDGGKGKSSMPNGSQVASGKQNGAPQKQRQGPRLPPLNIPQDHQPATREYQCGA
jgi:hypothetical protein